MKKWDHFKKRFTAWYAYLFHGFWRDEKAQLSRLRILLNHNILLFFVVTRTFFKDKLFDTAGALVYTSLLALVPFVAVYYLLLQAVGMGETMPRLLDYTLHPLGDTAVQLIVPQLMSFVSNTNTRTMGLIGSVLLLLSLIFIIGTIEYSFNAIWRVKRQRKFHRRLSAYILYIFIGPIIGLLLISWVANRYQLWIDSPPSVSLMTAALRNIGPWIITLLVFWYLIKFLPNTRVRFRSSITGAIVGTTLWMFTNWLFARFLDTAYIEGPQAAIYARFAVVPLLLVWIFVGWTILLFSAQLAYAHQNMAKLIWDRTHPYLSPMFYESLALKVLLRTNQQYFTHGTSSSEEELSDYFGIPESLISTVASELVSLHLINSQNGGEIRYTPARDPARIEVAEALIDLRNFDTAQRRHTRVDHIVRQVMGHADRSMKKSWKNITIKDLLEKLPED